MKWAILFLGVIATVTVLVVVLTMSGFGDIPCQDGQWSEARQTCIPD